MKNFLLEIFPNDLRGIIGKFNKLGLLKKKDMTIVLSLTSLAVLFEAFGVAMLFPIIEFIQYDKNVEMLASNSKLWFYAVKVFDSLSLPIGLLSLSLLVFILILLRQVVTYIKDITVAKYKMKTFLTLSSKCFSQMMRTKKHYLQDIGTGSFTFLLYNQCDSAGSIVNSICTLWVVCFTCLTYSIIMFIAAPWAFFVSAFFGYILIRSLDWLVKKARSISKENAEHGENYSKILAEKYRTSNLIRLSNSLKREKKDIDERTKKLYQVNLKLAETAARLQLIALPMMILIALISLYICVEYLDLTATAIMVFFVAVVRLMPMMQRFATIRQNINALGAYIDRISDYLSSSEQAIEKDEGTKNLKPLKIGIQFRDVSFNYENTDTNTVKNISVFLPAQKITAITGKTGSGKSTLLDLLPRIISPNNGNIFLDEQPIDIYKLSSLRSAISFIDQSPIIINSSLIENVRYVKPNASTREIENACDLALVSEFVNTLPDAYETVLGEQGYKISGGQRQRIALARAYLKESFILILDEPTSALDYETEKYVQDSLKKVIKEKNLTVIIVAHRLATIRNADHLIILKEGEVVEQGSPAKLSKSDGWYQSLLDIDKS